jgi:fermentation-respiration switch protein FrsA (DUF1100 family)
MSLPPLTGLQNFLPMNSIFHQDNPERLIHKIFLPFQLYTNEKYITAVRCPKFFVHSRDDEIVPFRHGQRLFELAGASGKFLELKRRT